ncbi:MAG: thiaminase II [Deltaproteobacteria bacterium]|nr:thiaminase II [Deltaproteobacteria bacterium]MBW2152991.1 thiaminase II [Deltaproteobacteria bacterium]
MSGLKFYETLRGETDELWQAIFSHPFVKGIGEGNLSRERYEFFLKQDYVYLIDFSRVFALASAKASGLEEMSYFATLLEATLNKEMALHRKTCAEFGISAEALEKTEPAMITTAYTNLLVRTCYEGSMSEILSVLLPCEAGYSEIGRRLKSRGLPEDPFYRDWIETYASEEFLMFANWLIDKSNQMADGCSPKARNRLKHLYVSSARFEYLFFEMSWNMQKWPAGLERTVC